MDQNITSSHSSKQSPSLYEPFDEPVGPIKNNWWLFYSLLAATLVTTILAGGLLFSISLMLILGAHEFGHYWASKRNGVKATLPYFIPAPPIFIAGTFGAFIQIKQRIPNRRVLMEIGAAGPIAGFIVALPALILGLHLSTVSPLTGMGGINFGSSIILNLCSKLMLGVNPSSPYINIHLHPIAFAGWIGMLVTALNLMPVSQLDGGHIIFAFCPDKHSLIGKLFFVSLFPLGFYWPGWFFWALMIAFMGFKTAPLKEGSDELGPMHKALGTISGIIFLLTFIPIPFSEI